MAYYAQKLQKKFLRQLVDGGWHNNYHCYLQLIRLVVHYEEAQKSI